jgi:hypothetical protein
MVQTPDLRAGFYTGYGVKTLPAVRESIEQKEWQLADQGEAFPPGRRSVLAKRFRG